MPLRSKTPRDKRPLLSSAPSNGSSGIAATVSAESPSPATSSSKRGGLLRLFGRSYDPPGTLGVEPTPSSSSSRRQTTPARTMDQRTIAPKRRQQQQPEPGTSKRLPKPILKENTSTTSTPRTSSPPRQLQENSKDSKKKERPYPVSVRKVRTNPVARDPPAHNAAPTPPEKKSSSTTTTSPETPVQRQHRHHADSLKRTTSTTQSSAFTDGTSTTTDIDLNSFANFDHADMSSSSSSSVADDDDESSTYSREEKKAEAQHSTHHHSTSTTTTTNSTQDVYEVLFARQNADSSHKPLDHHHRPGATRHATATPDRRQTTPLRPQKALLSRPFGRTSLPPEIARKWVVEVSSAEWDADEGRWKYRILVQRRQLTASEERQREREYRKAKQKHGQHVPKPPQHSFTTAFTWRSLADFLWLEKALRQEYHGGLLLPDLSIALGRAVNSNLEEMPIEADRLRNWLSDVLNGVRGEGELILDHEAAELLKSESMEAFLYRNHAANLDSFYMEGTNSVVSLPTSHGDYQRLQRVDESAPPSSFMQSLFTSLDLCVGAQPACGAGDKNNIPEMRDMSHLRKRLTKGLAVDLMTCQSRALSATPSLEVSDSFAESANVAATPLSTDSVIHSELLEAEKELVLSYRKTTLSAMEKLNHLTEQEDKLGAAWKRFAVSLSQLFAYEKDVETVRLGDFKAKKENLPYRKITKSIVDEGLMALAQQKEDRAVPALRSLSVMLSAYVADLSSVEPSVDVYIIAMQQATLRGYANTPGGHDETSRSRSWEDKLKKMATTAIGGMKKSFSSSSTEPTSDDCGETKNQLSHLLANERLLRQSLTALCRATPIRTSRMAWRYLHTEASQCALTHSSAVSFRTKLNVVSKDAVGRLVKRHLVEEKEDRAAEFAVIERIVNLGSSKENGEEPEQAGQVEIDTEDIEKRSRLQRREKVMRISRERPGKWDPTLAMAIMEAVGVDDPNVRVEETTRDLRLVRKYAIGLREHLGRCHEAFVLLQEAVVGEKQGANDQNKIALARSDFLVGISRVFSGMYVGKDGPHEPKRSSVSTTVLTNVGIDVSDPFGWTQPFESSQRKTRTTFTQGRVGDLAQAYFVARDSRIDWLLRCISDLLEEYLQRIETIEGCVYMECVGIQLEKFFSRKRTMALSAFEKKTDITAAMNIAMKKRMPKLLRELRAKLDQLAGISQTLVKETKEAHLESKEVKAKLHDIAMRRLFRARENSTERTIALIDLWAKEEELSSARELKALGEVMNALEQSISKEDIEALVYRFSKRSSTLLSI